MPAPQVVLDLIEHFRDNKASLKSGSYNETQTRREFLDPFFKELGWDIENKKQYSEAYKDVIHEDAIKIGGATKAPDYGFRVGGVRKFFLEAKKPSVNIKDDINPAYQLRRYAWSAKLPLSILTDFEEFAVYDCRIKPESTDRASTARIAYYNYEEYAEKWDEIAEIFSHEAVLKGSFDKYAEDNKAKRGTAEVDSAFLQDIESWREHLAQVIALRNPSLSVRELNTAVQRTIDRIVFLRIAEDRGIEPYGRLQNLKDGKDVYTRLTHLFRQADGRYNSGLFHFKKDGGSEETLDTFTLGLTIDDKVLKDIVKSLYYPDSPYEFSVLPADILGQVYEQFLGKVIRLSGKKAIIEEKPEVKKSGGVYYTPTYIVRYIVENTIGPLLLGKTPAQIAGQDKRLKDASPLRIVDPACGSGSFLIQAYQYLLDWYRDQYIADGPEKHAKGKDPHLYQANKGAWRLTIAERRRILLTHIYGVDVDQQAVEVTKLSLLLKVLEGESGDAIAKQMDLFKIRVLPDLGKNIKAGNSLISSDFFDSTPQSLFADDDVYRINAFDWDSEFDFVGKNGGFSAVIGNPPWISLTGKFRNEVYTDYEREYLVQKFSGNTYMPNVYEYFIATGLNLLRPNAYFGFIVPDRFGYNDQFIKLRSRIISDFSLIEASYRAPFPNITADTLIFVVCAKHQQNSEKVRIGNFNGAHHSVEKANILSDERIRFGNSGSDSEGDVIEHIKRLKYIRPLSEITATTSGFGGKSKLISLQRENKKQIEILKGESIQKYRVGSGLFFEFSSENITGRTTDKTKLGFEEKVLMRKTGRSIIAAYDKSGRYPEQSLYFTYGEAGENLFYILGVLNSSLMNFVYFHTALTNRDSIAQIKKVDLDALPFVRRGLKPDFDKLIQKVQDNAKSIHDNMERFQKAKTEQEHTMLRRSMATAERNIDNAIYDLYELSDEHRAVVSVWKGKTPMF